MKAFSNRLMRFLKENVVVIGLLVLYLCFISFWEDKAWSWLIGPVLSKFDCNWITTIVFVLLAILLLWRCILFAKRETIADWMMGLAVVSGGLWAWYRFTTDWAYPMHGLSRLCYVDIIVVAAVGCICVWLYQQFCCKSRKPNSEKVEGFTIDIPIDSRSEDLLGRKDRAENIAQKMMSTDVEKAAFTLGIVARWGEGKSSFMRMMKEYLKERYGCDLVVMDFNPWLYGKDVNLTHVFFDELRHVVSPLNWTLARRLRHYANTLAGTNTFFDKVATYSLLLFSDKNVTEQYEDLKKQVRQLEKKIVIFVDDVDRLESMEMMEVFHLVRNASNFPHMYFVIGYDKAYVIENMRSNLRYHCLSYTDKILQEEHMLPPMTNEQITNHLSRVINKILKSKEEDVIKTLFASDVYRVDMCQYIKNLRDIKRFDNILLANYTKLKGEVNMRDFVLFELLRWRYPLIHSFIEDKIDDVFTVSNAQVRLYISEEQDKKEDNHRFQIDSRVDLVKCLENRHEELHLRITDISRLKSLLNALWGKYRPADKFNINHPQYIARYFYNSLLEKDIPECEMQALLQMPFDEMKPTLKLLQEQKGFFLISYLERIPRDRTEIKLRLRMIFYINSIAEVWSVGDDVIATMLHQLKNLSSDNGYSTEIKQFLRDTLLENSGRPYVLRYLARKEENEQVLSQYPLSLDEIRELKADVFERYVQKNEWNLSEVFSVWLKTHTRIQDTKHGYDVLQEESVYEYNQIMRRLAASYFSEFIPLTIRRYPTDNLCYELVEVWPYLWKDFQDYYSYVCERTDDVAIACEYGSFLGTYYREGGGEICFEFKDIRV